MLTHPFASFSGAQTNKKNKVKNVNIFQNKQTIVKFLNNWVMSGCQVYLFLL
jgi:hypothetical protein